MPKTAPGAPTAAALRHAFSLADDLSAEQRLALAATAGTADHVVQATFVQQRGAVERRVLHAQRKATASPLNEAGVERQVTMACAASTAAHKRLEPLLSFSGALASPAVAGRLASFMQHTSRPTLRIQALQAVLAAPGAAVLEALAASPLLVSVLLDSWLPSAEAEGQWTLLRLALRAAASLPLAPTLLSAHPAWLDAAARLGRCTHAGVAAEAALLQQRWQALAGGGQQRQQLSQGMAQQPAGAGKGLAGDAGQAGLGGGQQQQDLAEGPPQQQLPAGAPAAAAGRPCGRSEPEPPKKKRKKAAAPCDDPVAAYERQRRRLAQLRARRAAEAVQQRQEAALRLPLLAATLAQPWRPPPACLPAARVEDYAAGEESDERQRLGGLRAGGQLAGYPPGATPDSPAEPEHAAPVRRAPLPSLPWLPTNSAERQQQNDAMLRAGIRLPHIVSLSTA